jgi:hypothetical protein
VNWFEVVLVSTLIGAVAGATVLAGVFEQVSILTDSLTGAAVGALLGNTVAYLRRRDGHVTVPVIVLRWTWLGAGAGIVVHLIVAAVR